MSIVRVCVCVCVCVCVWWKFVITSAWQCYKSYTNYINLLYVYIYGWSKLKSQRLPRAVTVGSSLLRSCGKRSVSDHSNCSTSNYPGFFLFIFRALDVPSHHNSNKTYLRFINIYLNCIISKYTHVHVSTTQESHFQGGLFKIISSFRSVG